MGQRQQQHFLFVTFPFQGHVNPALRLAKRLATITGSAVTFSTTISAHRRMFQSLSAPNQEFRDGDLSYIPFSDGYDEYVFKDFHIRSEAERYSTQFKLLGSKNVSNLVSSLAARHRPVTCIIYAHATSWAADVARDHAVPSALYWIQPATTFTIFYHYFHGYDSLIAAHSHDPSFEVQLPALPPLRIQDLPSLLTITDPDDPHLVILDLFRETFDTLDREQSRSKGTKTKVLLNTFDELEPDALAAIDNLDLMAIGPVLPPLAMDEKNSSKERTTDSGGDLFTPDEKGYMEWLDSKAEKTVVYVSFGSLAVLKERQLEEILDGLKESRRPYLWVVRKDSRGEGVDLLDDGENGMVVEWCNQVKVLSHPSVGCFVTHCGWNSTMESLACGVPMVAVPQWMDQGTNTRLMEEWGTGVRAVITEDGVLEGRELRRCVDVVLGEGKRGEEIRRKAEMWGEKGREAIGAGGSSDRNLKAFVEEIGGPKIAI